MEWQDDAIVLSARRHGEHGAVVHVLTAEHGRHGGMVHGGYGKALRGVLLPGNRLRVSWRARLAEQLGTMTCELMDAFAALALDDPGRLAAVASACALCDIALPEREPHKGAFDALVALLEALESEAWPSVYVHWELALLRGLGYGLDLERCAATGTNDGLAYVSPKTGRAVSLSAGEPWRDRLLPLPAFLVKGGEGDACEIAQGLALTGFFLERHVVGPAGRAMPAARSRLVDRMRP